MFTLELSEMGRYLAVWADTQRSNSPQISARVRDRKLSVIFTHILQLLDFFFPKREFGCIIFSLGLKRKRPHPPLRCFSPARPSENTERRFFITGHDIHRREISIFQQSVQVRVHKTASDSSQPYFDPDLYAWLASSFR